MSDTERRVAQAVHALSRSNPFLPERDACIEAALGAAYDPADSVREVGQFRARGFSGNVARLHELTAQLLEDLRGRILAGAGRSDEDLALYESMVSYQLYSEHRMSFNACLLPGAVALDPYERRQSYARFAQRARHFLALGQLTFPFLANLAHQYAFFYQLRRAYGTIFLSLAGLSGPMMRLRAKIWQSIFTHDLDRFREALFSLMNDFATLVSGPSGTGKELVARAIGLSSYLPYDPVAGRFAEGPGDSYYPVDLSTRASQLIESELFGHRRGAFTGAVGDHQGWLDVCGPHGAVFLDEIGNLEPRIQIQLLRVLQERRFQPLGDTETRLFRGKVIAATNLDLGAEMRAGRFRTDLYYRLCSDVVETPTLKEQFDDAPEDRNRLLLFLIGRILGQGAGDEVVTSAVQEVEAWIDGHLGEGYEWPGNVRELEQCARNLLVRSEYRPLRPGPEVDALRRAGERDVPQVTAGSEAERPAVVSTGQPANVDPGAGFLDAAQAQGMSAEALVARYCRHVYERTGSFMQTARIVGLDRRTVKRRIQSLAEL